jgi:hypothetical protein
MRHTIPIALALLVTAGLTACAGDDSGDGRGFPTADSNGGAAPDSDTDSDSDTDTDSDSDTDRDADGWTVDEGDCDDEDAARNPGAPEICNGIDDDCDSLVDGDDDDLVGDYVWYPDADGDGWGDEDGVVNDCTEPEGAVVTIGGDCDDGDPAVNPGATEICFDGVDNDCAESPECTVADGALLPGDELAKVTIGGTDAPAVALDVYDLDGDGVDDLVTGAWLAGPGGRAYIQYGPLTVDTDVETDADARLQAADDDDGAGGAVAAGDLDGDGLAELLVGAPWDDDGAKTGGAVFLLYGAADRGAFHGQLDAQADYVFYGDVSGAYVGTSAALVGDLDGDGLDDMLFGCGDCYTGYTYSVGAVSVLYGDTTRRAGKGTHEDADAVVPGGVDFGSVSNVAGGGHHDLDGDGFADIVFGDPYAGTSHYCHWRYPGQVQVLYGGSRWSGVLREDLTLTGDDDDEYLGLSVSMLPDTDGDGYDDFVVGGHHSATSAGAAYLVLGSAPRVTGSLTISDAAVTTLVGADEYDHFAYRVSAAGDQNGDGLEDVLVSATGAEEGATDTSAGDGAVYLFLGPLAAGTLASADASITLYPSTSGGEMGQLLGHGALTSAVTDDLVVSVNHGNELMLLQGGGP